MTLTLVIRLFEYHSSWCCPIQIGVAESFNLVFDHSGWCRTFQVGGQTGPQNLRRLLPVLTGKTPNGCGWLGVTSAAVLSRHICCCAHSIILLPTLCLCDLVVGCLVSGSLRLFVVLWQQHCGLASFRDCGKACSQLEGDCCVGGCCVTPLALSASKQSWVQAGLVCKFGLIQMRTHAGTGRCRLLPFAV